MVVLRMKVAVVGEATTGKTAWTQMVHSGGVTFPKNYMMTMGADVCIKEVQLDMNTTVEFFLFDIGGQEAYRSMVPGYLEGIAAFALFYDISNKSTLETCKKWITMCREENKNLPGILVGNKIDLMDKAELTDSQGELFARNNNLHFFKSSALRGVGIAEPLDFLAKMYVQQYNDRARVLQGMK